MDGTKTASDCLLIAKELNNEKVANMVMLGAIVRMTCIVKLDTIIHIVEKTLTGKKAELVPLNIVALNTWNK